VRVRAGIWLIGALFALAFAGTASAMTPSITEFSTGLKSTDNPFAITPGPDGNLWFTDSGTGRAIGRVSTAGSITKFSSGLPMGSSPRFIAAGPDGNLWFTDAGSSPAIGQIDTSGHVAEFADNLNPGSSPDAITAGPDASVWFTDRGATPAIGRVDGAGKIHEFALGPGSSPAGIAAGPDGNLWFTDQGSTRAIGRMDTAGHVHEFSAGLRPGSMPALIAAGPDGNLWFTDRGTTSAIGRVTPAGNITEFTTGLNLGSSPNGITAGPDGALWFTDQGTPRAIGRVDTSGGILEFGTGLAAGSMPAGIGAGPDGNVWFTDLSNTTPAVGSITTPPTATTVSASATGSTTAAVLGLVDGHAQPSTFHVEYGIPGGSLASTAGHNFGVTRGPTHVTAALGRLRPNTTYQARVVVANPTDTATGSLLLFTTGPPADRITRMRLQPKVMVPASRGGTVRPARAPGALVSYTGTQPASTTFTVEHAVQGRRQGRNCVRRNRGNRSAKPCTLLVKVGSFRHKDPVGRVRFRFTGRIRHHPLAPGNYRLDAEPRSAGGIGRTVHKNFSVKAARKKRG
jgi:streptogramin lyase